MIGLSPQSYLQYPTDQEADHVNSALCISSGSLLLYHQQIVMTANHQCHFQFTLHQQTPSNRHIHRVLSDQCVNPLASVAVGQHLFSVTEHVEFGLHLYEVNWSYGYRNMVGNH